MPLFMDFHIIDGITIEGLKEGHIADKALESKHNTRILTLRLYQRYDLLLGLRWLFHL